MTTTAHATAHAPAAELAALRVRLGPDGPDGPLPNGVRWDAASRAVVLDGGVDAHLVVVGDGPGAAYRTGRGDGAAYRSGPGSGDARRGGSGHGDAFRGGSGAGDARRSGTGDGAAYRWGTGTGAAYKSGRGRVVSPRVPLFPRRLP